MGVWGTRGAEAAAPGGARPNQGRRRGLGPARAPPSLPVPARPRRRVRCRRYRASPGRSRHPCAPPRDRRASLRALPSLSLAPAAAGPAKRAVGEAAPPTRAAVARPAVCAQAHCRPPVSPLVAGQSPRSGGGALEAAALAPLRARGDRPGARCRFSSFRTLSLTPPSPLIPFPPSPKQVSATTRRTRCAGGAGARPSTSRRPSAARAATRPRGSANVSFFFFSLGEGWGVPVGARKGGRCGACQGWVCLVGRGRARRLSAPRAARGRRQRERLGAPPPAPPPVHHAHTHHHRLSLSTNTRTHRQLVRQGPAPQDDRHRPHAPPEGPAPPRQERVPGGHRGDGQGRVCVRACAVASVSFSSAWAVRVFRERRGLSSSGLSLLWAGAFVEGGSRVACVCNGAGSDFFVFSCSVSSLFFTYN
jgi:hypothetical protein